LPRTPGSSAPLRPIMGGDVDYFGVFCCRIADYFRKLTCRISLVKPPSVSHTVVSGQLCSVVSSQLSVNKVAGVHLQPFKPNSRRVWPSCSAKSLRMKILTSNSFGWRILRGIFFSCYLFSIFCERRGKGGGPNRRHNIHRVHSTHNRLGSIEEFLGPLWPLSLSESIS
jgi:hypothetical protein